MENFGDDVLGFVLNWVQNPNDRKSFSQVCKQCLRVEGLTRISLNVYEPNLLPNLLPRFPNLVSFQSTKVITNSEIEFLGNTCTHIESLNLNYNETRCNFDEFYGIPCLDDFDDYGLSAVAINCSKLTKVILRRRCKIGNFGVISLVKLARNLVKLDLGRCNRVSDEALEAIGLVNCLEMLNLQGCCLITDKGLASLGGGYLSKTLKKLVISECDRITDCGLLSLREFCCLEELSLGECGPKVTDIGGLAIAGIQTLKRLNVSWLINISDVTMVALAQNCLNLVAVDLTGCESISGEGICAFGNHESLEKLVLARCHDILEEDLEELVFRCRSLAYIGLDKGLRMWVSVDILETISKSCWVDWI